METTATVVIYLAYYLALRQDMWNIMRTEVGSTNIEAEDIVDTLRQLPYLSAVIRVRLRFEITCEVG